MSRKICVVTGTRADYGLLFWLMKEIESDNDMSLQLIATGMHLSPEFGLTYKEIEKELANLNEKKISLQTQFENEKETFDAESRIKTINQHTGNH